MRTVSGRGLFEQDGVFHLFQPRLFQNAVPRLWVQIHGGMARNRDAPFFGRVFILAMAALEIHQHPSVSLQPLDCVTDFQRFDRVTLCVDMSNGRNHHHQEAGRAAAEIARYYNRGVGPEPLG